MVILLGSVCFLFVSPLMYCRSSWDGGPYDVHYSISDDSHCGPQRLEASVLGLRLVFCVGGCSLEIQAYMFKALYIYYLLFTGYDDMFLFSL